MDKPTLWCSWVSSFLDSRRTEGSQTLDIWIESEDDVEDGYEDLDVDENDDDDVDKDDDDGEHEDDDEDGDVKPPWGV